MRSRIVRAVTLSSLLVLAMTGLTVAAPPGNQGSAGGGHGTGGQCNHGDCDIVGGGIGTGGIAVTDVLNGCGSGALTGMGGSVLGLLGSLIRIKR